MDNIKHMGKANGVKVTKEDMKLTEDFFVQIFSGIFPGITFVDHKIVHPKEDPIKKVKKKK